MWQECLFLPCPVILWLFVTFNNWQISVLTCSSQCSGLWWTELISWSCKISYSSKYQALHKTVQNNLFNSIKMMSWKIYHIQCIFKKFDIALYTSNLTHLKAGAQKKIVWGPENKYNIQLIQNQKHYMISETTLITVVPTSLSPTPQIQKLICHPPPPPTEMTKTVFLKLNFRHSWHVQSIKIDIGNPFDKLKMIDNS